MQVWNSWAEERDEDGMDKKVTIIVDGIAL